MNPIKKLHDTVSLAFQRYDLSSWNKEPDGDVAIYGVYHIYCDKGWQSMVADQIATLKRSGLLERTRKLYISCITKSDNELREIVDIIDFPKAEIIAHYNNPEKFEYPALDFIKRKSEEDEHCLFYYFHTKGITYQSLTTNDREFSNFKRNIEAWRKMMEYFLFDKWRVAVNTLSADFDTYGSYRLPPPPRPYYLYAGNFWWARSEYIKRLPSFDLNNIKERFFAEEWLYRANPHDFSAFDTMADLYYVYISPKLYGDEQPSWWEKTKFVIIYNARKFRKQILGYDYKAHYQKKYQRLKSEL